MLTIICLSRNRHAFVKRLILAYCHTNFHLIIADDSTSKWDWPESGIFGSLTWEYFTTTGSTPQRSYIKRFREAASRVTTEFVCFMDDEEFIFPTGLERAIQELKLDSSASCAGGSISILLSENFGTLKLGKWGRRSDDYSLVLSTPIDRMKQIVNDTRTATLYYQVMRRELVIEFGKRIQAFNSQFHSSIEIFLALYLLKHGKWSMGSYPYWLRVEGLANKSDSKEYMTKGEISWIAESLFNNNSELLDRISLANEIENAWGESTFANNVQGFTWFKSLWRKMMNYSKSMIKKSHILTIVFKKWMWKPRATMSFKELFESYDLVSSDQLLEVAHIEAVLRSYPKGLQ